MDPWARVEAAAHGVLGTVHPDRGVDLVPVVFAVGPDRRVVIPIDDVKPKQTTRLRRERNLAADPRCSLLVEHYESDWSKLWWVRLSGTGAVEPLERWPTAHRALARRYPQYEQPDSIARLIVVVVADVTSWSADAG